MVSSKMGRQAKRHGDLSQPALSRSQREEADAGPVPARPCTPLLKFYLDQGLVVSRVHRAVQWHSHPWLKPFADFVFTSRRAADAEPNQKILGETAKLVGKAGFGRFIMDVTRHQEVRYEQDESKVARAINSFFFHDLEELSSEVFELKMFKKKIKCDLPIQIGFFVFTYAKLRML